jgi:hypothetical protein
MAKYGPLRDYLQKQTLQQIVLTFREIEKIIEAELPISADRPQWWENTTSKETSRVQREAWRAGSYDAFLLRGANKVRFERLLTDDREVVIERADKTQRSGSDAGS